MNKLRLIKLLVENMLRLGPHTVIDMLGSGKLALFINEELGIAKLGYMDEPEGIYKKIDVSETGLELYSYFLGYWDDLQQQGMPEEIAYRIAVKWFFKPESIARYIVEKVPNGQLV